MKKNKLLLISPLPPPYGGIARWTEQVVSYLNDNSIIYYKHLDTAVRWRSVHSNVPIRIIGGSFQFLTNYLKFLFTLIFGFNIIHLTSSGSFGLFRDSIFSLTSKIFKRKFIIHIRFGRVSEIFEKRNYEYYLLNLIFTLSDCIICIDEKTNKFLLSNERYSHKVKIIPNCIDFDFDKNVCRFTQKENVL